VYIVFEGIDGSGKTTLSTRLAALLRAAGHDVVHTREMGRYSSHVAQAIREVGRDPQNLRLSPTAEMMLGMAREAQVMEEDVRPALARGAHVITDRSVLSWIALSADGRGVDRAAAEKCAEVVTRGLLPDLVVVCDVDIRTSRRRKRLQKIADHRVGEMSRKGLSGLALRDRQRQSFLHMAAADPTRWIVVDATNWTIDQEMAVVADAVGRLLGKPLPGPAATPRAVSAQPAPEVPASVIGAGGPALLQAFYDLLEPSVEGDAAFAAFLLAGFDDERADALRERLRTHHPALVAWGLQGCRSPGSIALREALAERETDYVVRSVTGLDDEWAWSLRERYVERAPRAAASSLRLLAGERAFAMRRAIGKQARAEVLGSLSRLDTPEAWELRRKHGPKDLLGLGKSLTGLDGGEAWAMRDEYLHGYPLGLIPSLAGMPGDRAMRTREELLALAPRLVLGSLRGLGTPESFAMRDRVSHMAKELLDSVFMLDVEPAWELRRRHAEAWPHTAIRSLGPLLARSPRGGEFLRPIVTRNRADLHVVKVAALVLTRPLVDEDNADLEVELPT
jgi:dTMP kinase